MDPAPAMAESPGAPLTQASPERVNQGRIDVDGAGSPINTRTSNSWSRHSRDSSVHEKVAQFNSLAMQSKALERKTHDAALKRAMLGREEAEAEMRRYRDDVLLLRKQIEEGQDRERRVGERLEEVMERYARTKETFTNTKSVWEKEIRKARKEAFKAQSQTVQAQEEVKSARDAMQKAQASYDEIRKHTEEREQEAFSAKYQLVEVQEQLEKALQTIKLVEQERDAFKEVAKNEEVARIAAEGRIPLPTSKDDDEFATPKKPTFRPSLPPAMPIAEDAKTQIEELRRELLWERQRADRAYEQVDFLITQCDLCCPRRLATSVASSNAEHSMPTPPGAEMDDREPEEGATSESASIRERSPLFEREQHKDDEQPRDEGQPREEDGHALRVASGDFLIPSTSSSKPTTPIFPQHYTWESSTGDREAYREETRGIEHAFTRAPSAEPQATSVPPQSHARTSLQSLLDAPMLSHNHNESAIEDDPEDETSRRYSQPTRQEADDNRWINYRTISTTTRIPLAGGDDENKQNRDPIPRPKSSAASYPGAYIDPDSRSQIAAMFCPTMTREEALAQIRERRGRAKSIAQGTMTPRKQMVEGAVKREFSAPTLTQTAPTPARGRSRSRPRAAGHA